MELSIGSGADRVLWDGGKRSEWRQVSGSSGCELTEWRHMHEVILSGGECC